MENGKQTAPALSSYTNSFLPDPSSFSHPPQSSLPAAPPTHQNVPPGFSHNYLQHQQQMQQFYHPGNLLLLLFLNPILYKGLYKFQFVSMCVSSFFCLTID